MTDVVLHNYTGHVVAVVAAPGMQADARPVKGFCRGETVVEMACHFEQFGRAELESRVEQDEDLEGFPTVRRTFGEIRGLPERQDGVVYIVGSLVHQTARLAGRDDVVAPDSGDDAIRDEKGRTLAVWRFIR